MNNGFIQAPSAKYFSGPLTITTWVKILSVENYLIGGTFFLYFFGGTQFPIVFLQFAKINYFVYGMHNPSIWAGYTMNYTNWNHFAVTMDGAQYYKLFLNGNLVSSVNTNVTADNILRYKNYIGGSSSNLGNLILDDIKFFNRALNITEIQKDMNSF